MVSNHSLPPVCDRRRLNGQKGRGRAMTRTEQQWLVTLVAAMAFLFLLSFAASIGTWQENDARQKILECRIESLEQGLNLGNFIRDCGQIETLCDDDAVIAAAYAWAGMEK